MLNQETIALEYWRKKYFSQAIIVLTIALAIICLTLIYADFIGLKILITLSAGSICYLMIRELREDLQTRGEALILPRAAKVMKNISFDYGKGINENTLLNQDIAGPYKILEYHNIFQNELFHYEEDLFYSVISSKFIPLKQTAFEGIIFSFDMPSATAKQKTVINFIQNQPNISGFLSETLKKPEFMALLNELNTLFNPQKIDIVTENGKNYFWIKTKSPLFYQFSLTSPNSVSNFINRLEKLQNIAEKISHTFAVDKP